MWPFSRKKPHRNAENATTVASALQQLASLGIRMRAGVSQDDLLDSLGGRLESPVDWVQLLCTLGSEDESGDFQQFSDDIWHFDSECIAGDGDYVAVVNRLVALTKGVLPITGIRDHVDIEAGEAWVEFDLDMERVHWDLEATDDYLDTQLYSRFQELALPRGEGRRFFIAPLGQDGLISFGDEPMRAALSQLSGLKFQWE